MSDIENIELMISRGKYSTIRSQHEDAKKELSIACSALQSVAGQILRKIQPTEKEVVEGIDLLLATGKLAMVEIERVAATVESLAKQRAQLKKDAWQ